MDYTQVIVQIAILFMIMGLGYYLRYKKIISSEGIKNFSALIFYVTMPAMILVSIVRTETATMKDVVDIVIASFIAYVCLILFSFIVPRMVRAPKGSVGLYRFMTLFGNVGFIGFPMIIAILGREQLFLGALFNIPYNLLLFTIGVYYVVSDFNKDHKLKFHIGQLLNPGIIMTILALLIFLVGGTKQLDNTNIKWLTTAVNTLLDTAEVLGMITTPLAMLVVGGSLYGVRLENIYKNYRVMIFSIIRMVAFPFIIGMILSLIGLSYSVVAVAIVLVGMPIATNTVIVTTQYGGNIAEASEAVFISTVFMGFTSPILVLLIDLLT